MRKILLLGLAALLSTLVLARATTEAATTNEPQTQTLTWKYYLAPGAAPAGWTKVTPTTAYSAATGYGYESLDGITQSTATTPGAGYTTDNRPFYFSVSLPEGNYHVAVTLSGSDTDAPSDTTIKAELRRLMLENIATAPGATTRREFTVNVRRSEIVGAQPPAKTKVALKPREQNEEKWSWDDKLTLEFNANAPARAYIAAIEITRNDRIPTLFILGDSTVCDQPREPYASWGQMITRFFKPDIAVANHAESGESYQSSFNAGRLDKVLSQLRPGDTVMMQFGHNDMKAVDVPTYKASIQQFVTALRAKKASVILVTQVQRRTFDHDGKITNSHKGYPDAVREVAREQNLPLIDLHAMSTAFYEAMGKEASAAAFKPGDGTHHNAYGAYELAKCIIESVREQKLPLASYITEDFAPFNPSKPDDVTAVKIPASATAMSEKPEGS